MPEKAALSDPFAEVTDALKAQERPPRQAPNIYFILFMLALTALFAVLGHWQTSRLAEKETLIARIGERASLSPVPLPPVGEWVGLDPFVWDYRPVTLTGHFLHEYTIRAFTSLSEPRGESSGPGYWIITPFVREDGGVVMVNRGFVPDTLKDIFADGGPAVGGTLTLTGIARASEQANAFTPGADMANRIDWIRNVDRLATMLPAEVAPVASVYVDQAAGAPGELPQGGETRMSLPNRHLEYAMTWYALAGVTPLLLLVWLFSRIRK